MEAKRSELVLCDRNQITHAIDLFYGEINAAIQPLTAFCTAQRAHYQLLVDRINELDTNFRKNCVRVWWEAAPTSARWPRRFCWTRRASAWRLAITKWLLSP